MEELLMSVAKLSPVFAVLVVVIYALYKERNAVKSELTTERDKFTDEISKLNKEIRDNEIENIKIISKLSDVLDKLSDKMEDNHDAIKEGMKDIHSLIKEKINELKNSK